MIFPQTIYEESLELLKPELDELEPDELEYGYFVRLRDIVIGHA